MSFTPLAFLRDERQPLMAFIYHQIFCDESGKYHNPNDPLIAFAGVCANPDRLNPFDREWRSLLRSYEIDDLHLKKVSRLEEEYGYRFRAHQTLDERTELLIPFADCINKHLEMGFIQAYDVNAYNSVPYEAKILLGGSSDPYMWAFIRGLMEIVNRIGEDDRISIICDDDRETAWDSYIHYREVGKAEPEIQKKAVSLTFANDRHFPALQAADMVAFLAKHKANEDFFGIHNIWHKLFTRLTTEPEPPFGIMRWFYSPNDARRIVDLANSLNEVVERRKREKQAKQKPGISKLRSHVGGAVESSPQRVKEETRSGESGKAASHSSGGDT